MRVTTYYDGNAADAALTCPSCIPVAVLLSFVLAFLWHLEMQTKRQKYNARPTQSPKNSAKILRCHNVARSSKRAPRFIAAEHECNAYRTPAGFIVIVLCMRTRSSPDHRWQLEMPMLLLQGSSVWQTRLLNDSEPNSEARDSSIRRSDRFKFQAILTISRRRISRRESWGSWLGALHV